MTGFDSKRKAALDEEGMYLVHPLVFSDFVPPQPAQEPVAMLERDPSIGRLRVTYEDSVTELDEGVYPLYTKPQGWRDNVAQAYLKGFDEGCKSKVKNASKPIAWLEPEWGEKICPEVGYEVTMTDDHPRDLCWIPLYAHPPQPAQPAQEPTLQEKDRKRGSIALARSLCYQIAGAASEYDDISGSDYGSVDVAEILSAEIVRLQAALAQPAQERNFCPRCGKRTADLTVIHTCTPPQDKNT